MQEQTQHENTTSLRAVTQTHQAMPLTLPPSQPLQLLPEFGSRSHLAQTTPCKFRLISWPPSWPDVDKHHYVVLLQVHGFNYSTPINSCNTQSSMLHEFQTCNCAGERSHWPLVKLGTYPHVVRIEEWWHICQCYLRCSWRWKLLVAWPSAASHMSKKACRKM